MTGTLDLWIGVKVKSLSRVRLFATPWTAAHQTPLSMEFSRQEHWSGLPCPSSGDVPDSGINPGLLHGLLHCRQILYQLSHQGSPPACQCRRHKRCGFDPWVGMIPWRRAWQPTPVFLPGEFHGQRSMAGYSPWGHKELDTTEQLTLSQITTVS